jgi:hypothetical protein
MTAGDTTTDPCPVCGTAPLPGRGRAMCCGGRLICCACLAALPEKVAALERLAASLGRQGQFAFALATEVIRLKERVAELEAQLTRPDAVREGPPP